MKWSTQTLVLSLRRKDSPPPGDGKHCQGCRGRNDEDAHEAQEDGQAEVCGDLVKDVEGEMMRTLRRPRGMAKLRSVETKIVKDQFWGDQFCVWRLYVILVSAQVLLVLTFDFRLGLENIHK